MKLSLLAIAFLLFALSAFSKQVAPTPPTASAPPAVLQSKGCLAVKDAGSHAFRNIMLGGVAGAIVSKKQYQVVDVVDYPARVGQKFHGNDLQTLQNGGTRIVILDKKYSQDELKKACH